MKTRPKQPIRTPLDAIGPTPWECEAEDTAEGVGYFDPARLAEEYGHRRTVIIRLSTWHSNP